MTFWTPLAVGWARGPEGQTGVCHASWMLNNREHAEHLLTAIDRLRENRKEVTSREKGYWLDLLEYRDDETGRCDPGRRELEAKTRHGHRALKEMDVRAEELGLYWIEQFKDERGRLRNGYVWNAEILGFDNEGQPTRVLAHHAPFREKGDRPRVTTGRPDDRGQVTSKRTSLLRRKTVREEEDGPVLCGQLTTMMAATSPPGGLERAAAASTDRDDAGDSSAGGVGRQRKWELLREIGELTKQSQALPAEDGLGRYTLNAQIASLQRELGDLPGIRIAT